MASTLLGARNKRNRAKRGYRLLMFPGIFVALFVLIVLVTIARELMQSPKRRIRSSTRQIGHNNPDIAPHVQGDHRHTGTYNGHNPATHHPGGHGGGHAGGGHAGGGHAGGGHAGGGGHGH
jgi:uncharacterized membrane protein YgcG